MLDVGTDLFYKRAKFQLETPYILDSAKITKVEIWSSEQCELWNSKKLSDFVIFVWPKMWSVLSWDFAR
jgi:hypothetical protein